MAMAESVATLAASSVHSLKKGTTIESTTLPGVMTPAWIVYAWTPVLWQSARAPDLHLVHLGTRVLNLGDEDCPCSGQTLWADNNNFRVAGVAWDWVEVREGVLAMSDPLGVVTNLRLTDAHGKEVKPRELAVQLHQMVYALPWQDEVRRALRNKP